MYCIKVTRGHGHRAEFKRSYSGSLWGEREIIIKTQNILEAITAKSVENIIFSVLLTLTIISMTFCFCFYRRVSLCSPGCHLGTLSVDKTVLKVHLLLLPKCWT